MKSLQKSPPSTLITGNNSGIGTVPSFRFYPLARAAPPKHEKIDLVMHHKIGYIRKHWQGQLGPFKSVFINCIFLLFFYGILSEAVLQISYRNYLSSQTIAWISISVIALRIIIFTWAIVGAVRSIHIYFSTNSLSITIGAYLIILGVFVLSSVFVAYVTILPTVALYSEIASGRDPLGPAALISVSDDGKSVSISGIITAGSSERFIEATSQSSALEEVYINSPGGRVADALSIAKYIEERNLNTIVVSKCTSACPIIFLAGKNRKILAPGKIGFHNLYDPISYNNEMDDRVLRSYLLSRGLPLEFIEKVSKIDRYNMYYPEIKELQTLNVTT